MPSNPKVKVLPLYRSNAKGVFFHVFEEDRTATSGCDQGISFLFRLVCLPISMTLFAGLKTLFDVATRKPLTTKDMDQLLTTIPKLTDEKLDHCVNELIKYEAKSNSSRKLIKDLIELKQSACCVVGNVTKSLRENRVDIKEKALYSQIDPGLHRFVTVKRAALFSAFTAEEKQELSHIIAEQTNPFLQNLRQTQRQLLVDYVSDAKNIGKKALHVIAENSDEVQTSDFKI